MRGGTYLAARQAMGTFIAVVGVLVLTRIIGPSQYGLFAAALGVFTVARIISQLGVNVYLIRHEVSPDTEVCGTATTLLLMSAVVTTLILFATIPLTENFTRLAGYRAVAFPMFGGLFLNHLSQVPMAMIERKLDYRRTAWVEVIAQLSFVMVAVPRAVAGDGARALVLGWWVQQIVTFALFHMAARRMPS